MFSTGPDNPQKSFQIKQDGKFFSSLLTKESSMANPSFRVYYGGVSVAVPFMWESEPGKSKYKLCESTLPPLTPPPSYYSASNKKPTKKHSRSNLLHILFPRIIIKRANASALPSTNSASTPSPTPSSASRSSLISSGSLSPARRTHRGQSLGLSFDSRVHDEEPPSGWPTSTLRFSTSKGNGGRFQRDATVGHREGILGCSGIPLMFMLCFS